MFNWREIPISATPTEVATKYKYAVCPLWVNETQGQWIGKFNGRTLPTLSGNATKPPTILALEDEFPQLIPFLSNMKKGYNLCRDTNFVRELSNIFSQIVTPERNCIFVRPDSRVAPCQRFLSTIHKLNTKFESIKYFGCLDKSLFGGGKTKHKTLKEVLLDNYKDQNRYGLIITSSGRSKYGDSFPNIVGNYFDFYNPRSFNWESLRQATIGRACGFGKQSVVYLRKWLVEEWTKYFKDGCLDHRLNGRMEAPRADHEMRLNQGKKRGRRPTTLTITFD
jgi:hypothetical protein